MARAGVFFLSFFLSFFLARRGRSASVSLPINCSGHEKSSVHTLHCAAAADLHSTSKTSIGDASASTTRIFSPIVVRFAAPVADRK